MKIPFYKYHANGNDFILIKSKNLEKKHHDNRFIRRLCDRYTGIGADGMFIIYPSAKYHFFLDYYNSDGGCESFCANGSRCAAKFMFRSANVEKKLLFETGAGIHLAEILPEGDIIMSMKIPNYKSRCISPCGVPGYFIDSGARHFVCESENINDEYVFEMGRKIRNAPEFQPRGINVNFYRLIDNNNIQIKTYEKGVEQVMLSCASGSAAVVFHLARNGLITSPVTTISSGGNLFYTFDEVWEEFLSTGPAKDCFSGEFNLEDYI